MPVVRKITPKPPAHRDELVGTIAREWTVESQSVTALRQPLIMETRIGRTDDLSVVVIWDRWKGVSEEERPYIIQDAFQKANNGSSVNSLNQRILIALGLTAEEAILMGFLSYKIERYSKYSGPFTPDQIVTVMQQEGIFTDGRGGPQLHFRTEDDAGAAYESLNQKIPGAWALVRETSLEVNYQ